jgi:K+-transporting ATPase KdpF subunit
MLIDYAVGATVSGLLAIYLTWALLRPERF